MAESGTSATISSANLGPSGGVQRGTLAETGRGGGPGPLPSAPDCPNRNPNHSLAVNFAPCSLLLARSWWSIALFFLCAAVSLRGANPEAEALIAAGIEAEARFDLPAALEFYRQANALQPNDSVILQKIAKQLSNGADEIADVKERSKQIQEALSYSERALEISPKNPECLLSMAVCYGKLAKLVDNATKVEYSRRVKKYAEEALAVDPKYDWAHHVLGCWNYEVALIGGPTRVAARLLYGGLPPASCKEAIKHLEKAIELNPKVPAHYVELGYAYLANGDKNHAVEQWKRSLEIPSLEKHDESSKARARAGLQRFK